MDTAQISAEDPFIAGPTEFDIIFQSNGTDCVAPQISFEFEKIDYDELDEYINVTDNDGQLMTQCVAKGSGYNECGAYENV